jgi:hypothetical protein
MDETAKKIGVELRYTYRACLRLPLNWRMIDALVTLEGTENQPAADASEDTVSVVTPVPCPRVK